MEGRSRSISLSRKVALRVVPDRILGSDRAHPDADRRLRGERTAQPGQQSGGNREQGLAREGKEAHEGGGG